MKTGTKPKIILASSSPRRKELLEGLGLTFHIHPSHVDESVPVTTPPAEVVKILALRKALSVASQFDEGLVIGSDTIVVLGEIILGKPKDEDDAFSMLQRLQGNEHRVFSGIAVVDVASGKSVAAYQETKVIMRPLAPEEIRDYIATGEPLDKAGAYAIQGIGATLVEGIVGDYFTVVGLPLGLLAKTLRQFGIDVLKRK
jgi:septum formation protein